MLAGAHPDCHSTVVLHVELEIASAVSGSGTPNGARLTRLGSVESWCRKPGYAAATMSSHQAVALPRR
jgi:hypothetical protein